MNFGLINNERDLWRKIGLGGMFSRFERSETFPVCFEHPELSFQRFLENMRMVMSVQN